jgi:hypothetical protein
MKIKSQLRRSLVGTAKASAPALLGLALLGYVAPGTAGASPATYTAQAKSAGLVINLFGTQLTGGTATASVDSSAPSATGEGVGVLTPGLIEDQKASAGAANQTDNLAKACQQGGSLPASSPISVTLGLACSSAAASISGGGVPSAAATGEIAGLDVNVSGVLNQIISSGGDQLISGIQQVLAQVNGTPLGDGTPVCPDLTSSGSSTSTGSTSTSSSSSSSGSTTNASSALSALATTASVPGSPLNQVLGSLGLGTSTAASSSGPLGTLLDGLCQTLTNIENVVKGANPPSTLVVDIGPASASVIGTAADTAQAIGKGATAEVQVLPGVGCDASSLAACITNPSAYAVPLIDITVAPAEAIDNFDGNKWTPSTNTALVTVALNIPGDVQTITVGPGQSLDLLSGTPLETVIDLGSASTSGWAGTANGATLDLAKGVNGGILLDLGSSSITGGDSPATAAAPPTPNKPTTPARVAKETSAAPPAIAPAGPSPTLVHTGAWWSGSMPYLGGLAVLGGGLLGWPKLRRTSKALGTLLRAARR